MKKSEVKLAVISWEMDAGKEISVDLFMMKKRRILEKMFQNVEMAVDAHTLVIESVATSIEVLEFRYQVVRNTQVKVHPNIISKHFHSTTHNDGAGIWKIVTKYPTVPSNMQRRIFQNLPRPTNPQYG